MADTILELIEIEGRGREQCRVLLAVRRKKNDPTFDCGHTCDENSEGYECKFREGGSAEGAFTSDVNIAPLQVNSLSATNMSGYLLPGEELQFT